MRTIPDMLTLLAVLPTLPDGAVLVERAPPNIFFTRAECAKIDCMLDKQPSDWVVFPLYAYDTAGEAQEDTNGFILSQQHCNSYGCKLHYVTDRPTANIDYRR